MTGARPEPPPPPEPPDPQSCCQRGCYPCIFDYYDAAMERWEARVRALGYDPAAILAQVKDKGVSG